MYPNQFNQYYPATTSNTNNTTLNTSVQTTPPMGYSQQNFNDPMVMVPLSTLQQMQQMQQMQQPSSYYYPPSSNPAFNNTFYSNFNQYAPPSQIPSQHQQEENTNLLSSVHPLPQTSVASSYQQQQPTNFAQYQQQPYRPKTTSQPSSQRPLTAFEKIKQNIQQNNNQPNEEFSMRQYRELSQPVTPLAVHDFSSAHLIDQSGEQHFGGGDYKGKSAVEIAMLMSQQRERETDDTLDTPSFHPHQQKHSSQQSGQQQQQKYQVPASVQKLLNDKTKNYLHEEDYRTFDVSEDYGYVSYSKEQQSSLGKRQSAEEMAREREIFDRQFPAPPPR